MSDSRQHSYFQHKEFLTNVKKLLSALPSDSEKKETQANLNILIDFIDSMRKSLLIVPSKEESADIVDAVQKLEDLYKKAQSDPVLANMFGLSRPTKPKRSTKFHLTEEGKIQANKTLVELEALPIDNIRTKLASDTVYPLADLKALAVVMGIRSIEKLGRETLAHQITMKIANFRGYKQLSGQNSDGQHS